MKKQVKVFLLCLCVVALIGATLAGTLAYLTDQAEVTNTFTVGKVAITMDEAKVDAAGEATSEPRVTENSYHLIPGKTYDKDPTIHILEGSEESWLFVRVANGLEGLEGAPSVADQMAANGWVLLDAQNGIYSYSQKVAAKQDVTVFETLTIGEFADLSNLPADATIHLTAYAIQADGFDSAAAAWVGVLAQLDYEGKTL